MRRGPHLVQEAPDAHDAGLPEVAAFLEGPEEHEVHAERVRTPLLDVGVGDHHVAPRLGHLRAVLDDEPVRAELGERLLEVHVAQLPQHHSDKPGVQQMQDRKSTRLNSSHGYISYAVFCLKKKKKKYKSRVY